MAKHIAHQGDLGRLGQDTIGKAGEGVSAENVAAVVDAVTAFQQLGLAPLQADIESAKAAAARLRSFIAVVEQLRDSILPLLDAYAQQSHQDPLVGPNPRRKIDQFIQFASGLAAFLPRLTNLSPGIGIPTPPVVPV